MTHSLPPNRTPPQLPALPDVTLTVPARDNSTDLQSALTQLRHLQQHHPREGLQLALSLRRVSRRNGDEMRAAWASHHGSACALRLSRLALSEALNRDAKTRFSTLHHIEGVLAGENVAGLLSQARGQHGEAYTRFHSVMLAAEDRKLPRLYAMALNNLALSAQHMGDPEAALGWTIKSLDYAEAQGEQENEASTLTNAVPLALKLGHIEQAERYAVRAHDLAKTLALPMLYSVTLNNLSVVRSAQSRHVEALQAAEESLKIESQTGSRTGMLYALVQRSSVMLDLGQADQALRDLRSVAVSAPPIESVGNSDADIRIELLHLLGRAHMLRGEWEQGREHLDAAERGARSFDRPHLLTKTLRERSTLEERAGNLGEALRRFQAFHDQERRVLDEQYAQRSHALMLTHEVREHRRLNAELTTANAHLQHVANHDSLTGCLNRGAFTAAAHELLSRIRESAAVLIDLDHFKRINDTYGHNAGDDVLKAAVSVVRSCVREGDMLCRWGGEEFILLLPHATAQQAAALCARIKAAMQAHTWPVPTPVTASFGICGREANLEDMTAHADEALYQAKNNGRNQAVIYKTN